MPFPRGNIGLTSSCSEVRSYDFSKSQLQATSCAPSCEVYSTVSSILHICQFMAAIFSFFFFKEPGLPRGW